MLHYGNIHWCIVLHIPKLFPQYFSGGWHNYFCYMLIMHKITGEAGSKHVISTMQGDGVIIYVQHRKMCGQEVTSQYNGLVISRTKHCCVNIKYSITKSNVVTLFIITFLPVRSITFSCF